jgi:hypothetical protein
MGLGGLGWACSRQQAARGAWSLLGVVVTPRSYQVKAAAGSPPSSPVLWIEVGQWSTLLLRGAILDSLLSVGEPKGDSLQHI